MTFHANLSHRAPSGSLRAMFCALVLGLALAPPQPVQAAIGGIEARDPSPGPERPLLPEARTETAPPMIVADKNWHKNGNKNWNKNWNNRGNKNWSKNWNNQWGKPYNYNKKKYKYSNKRYKYNDRYYVRRWAPKPYYGEFFGGIVLGSILTAAAIGVAPPPPAPELCWYWMDPYQSRGYWDYCPPY